MADLVLYTFDRLHKPELEGSLPRRWEHPLWQARRDLVTHRFVTANDALDALVPFIERCAQENPQGVIRAGHGMTHRRAEEFGWQLTEAERRRADPWETNREGTYLGVIENIARRATTGRPGAFKYEWRLVNHELLREDTALVVRATWNFRLMVRKFEVHTIEAAGQRIPTTVDLGLQPWRPWARWKWPDGSETTDTKIGVVSDEVSVVGDIKQLQWGA